MPTKAKLVDSAYYMRTQKKAAGLRITKEDKVAMKSASTLDETAQSVLNSMRGDDLAGKAFCINLNPDQWGHLNFNSMPVGSKRYIEYIGFDPHDVDRGQKYMLILSLRRDNETQLRFTGPTLVRTTHAHTMFEYDFANQHWFASSRAQFIDDTIGAGGPEAEFVNSLAEALSLHPYLLDENSTRGYLEDSMPLLLLHKSLNGLAKFQVVASGPLVFPFLVPTTPVKRTMCVSLDGSNFVLSEMIAGEEYLKNVTAGNVLSGFLAVDDDGKETFFSLDPVLTEGNLDRIREKVVEAWN